jgi:hypothetical protein
VYIYPFGATGYLMAGGRNPTRHDLILPRYQSDEEVQSVIETLEHRRIRHAYLMRFVLPPKDPIIAYIERHYRCDDAGACVRDDARAPEADATSGIQSPSGAGPPRGAGYR